MTSQRDEFLRKLDEALLEGRISEETYRELKARYEAERGPPAPSPPEERRGGGAEGFLDRIRGSLRATQLRGEIRAIERKMESVASRAGLRLYELVRSGRVSVSDPEIEAALAELDSLSEEKRRKEEELRSL